MSIADLPNELLLEIASYLSFNEPSRVHLAITCPRLYSVFMPGILKDQVDHVGKLIAESKVMLYKDFEARRLVLKKTFISESFRTPYHTLVYRVSGIEKDLWCVKSLIARALYLQDVVLQLAQPCSLPKLAAIIIACAVRQGVQLTVSGTIRGGESGGPFTIQFHSSESLLIAFPKGNKPTSATSKVKSRPRLFRKIFYLLSKFFSNRKPMPSTTAQFTTNVRICTEQKAYAVPRQPQFDIVVPPKLVLPSLKIDSGTPFLPSLYPFTLAILNRAPITDLSLSHISFTLFVWSQILPSITMPTLAKLSIGNLSIAFPDLLAFLERHHFIETLDLTDNDVVGVVKLPPTDLLPNLNLFIANSEYIVPFLEHRKLGYFPVLQNFYLQSPKAFSAPPIELYPYKVHQNHSVYDLLCQGLSTDLCLTLDILATSGLIEWLLHNTDGDETPGTAQLRQLYGFQKLIIADKKLSIMGEMMHRLFKWISGDTYYFLIRKRPGDYDSQLSRDHQIVERLIWYTCPQLETLQLGIEGKGRLPPIRLARISWE